MVQREVRYFKPAGKSDKVLNKFLCDINDIGNLREDFCKEMGAQILVYCNSDVVGAIFHPRRKVDTTIWSQAKDTISSGKGKELTYYVPNRRTRVGRSTADYLRNLSMPDAMDLTNMLGVDVRVVQGKLYHVGLEAIGTQYIFAVPVQCHYTPSDAIEIKHSEFWRMVEESEKDQQE